MPGADTFPSAWQAWYFWDVAKTLAGVGQNERWVWKSFFVAGLYLVNLDDVLTGSKAAFCETVVIFDFGHDDFCCSALRILISLTQPSRQFGRVGSLSLWCGANFEMAPATFLALCACRIALVLVRC